MMNAINPVQFAPVLARRIVCGVGVLSGILTLLIMAAHISEPAQWLGRYSTPYLMMMLIIATLTVLAWAGAMWAERWHLSWLPLPPLNLLPWFLLIVGAVIFVFWVFFPGSRIIPGTMAFALYLVAMLMSLTGLWLAEHDRLQAPVPGLRPHLLLPGALALAGVMTVLYLGRVPEPMTFDDQMLVNSGVTYFETGTPGYSMLFNRASQISAFHSMGFWLKGAWLQATDISVEMARLFWLGWLWLCAPLLYATARRWYGPVAGVVSAGIVVLVALNHNLIRPDPILTFALSLALFAFSRVTTTGGLSWHFLTGFAVAMSVEGHPLGLMFIVAFGLYYGLTYAPQMWHRRSLFIAPFWAFVLGGLVLGGIYLYVHVYINLGVDLPTFLSTARTIFVAEHTLYGDVTRLEKWLARWPLFLQEYAGTQPVDALAFVAGAGLLATRRWHIDRVLLGLLLVVMCIFIFLAPNYSGYYRMHFLPFVAVFGGAFCAWLEPRLAQDQHRLSWGGLLLCLSLTGLALGQQVVLGQRESTRQIIETGYLIDDVLPPDVAPVSGHQVYYYGLADRPFYSNQNFTRGSVKDVLARYDMPAPQAIILTADLDEYATLIEYIAEMNMVALHCLPIGLYGGVARVYVLPELAVEAQGCA